MVSAHLMHSIIQVLKCAKKKRPNAFLSRTFKKVVVEACRGVYFSKVFYLLLLFVKQNILKYLSIHKQYWPKVLLFHFYICLIFHIYDTSNELS